MLNQTRGLDKDGFIENLYSHKNIAPEFQEVVSAVIDSLLSGLPNQIDGIYLYGSVPRGTAVVGRSDLDVSIVLNTPIGQKEKRLFQHLYDTIPKAYPQVSKLDIDPGFLSEVLQPQEKFHWQFWLKHCCCCIWGNDLSIDFPRYKPSSEIAQALNGDLSTFLDQMSLICSSQTGHLAKRHFAFQSSLGLGTQEHCAFSFDYNQLLCTRRSFGASALSS